MKKEHEDAKKALDQEKAKPKGFRGTYDAKKVKNWEDKVAAAEKKV